MFEFSGRMSIGIWSIPNSQYDAINGNFFKCENGKYELLLHDCFGGFPNMDDNQNVPIINGFTADGKNMTLIDCHLTKSNLSMPGFVTVTYSPRIIVIGKQYSTVEEIKLIEISACYNNFEKWFNVNAFKTKYDSQKNIYVNCNIPKKLIWKVDNEDVEVRFSTVFNSNGFNESSIYQKQIVAFKFNHPIDFESAIRGKVTDFGNLLTLCIGTRILPYDIKGKDIGGTEIEFLYHGLKVDQVNQFKNQFYVYYTDLESDFENYLNMWSKKSKQIEPILGYFIDAHNKTFDNPMSFIKITQALEAFSRRMRNNEDLPIELHEDRVRKILDSLTDEEYKNWVSELMQYSNEPRLRKRLGELFKETNYVFNISSKNRKSMINKIVNTRNYYTHFDKKKEHDIMSLKELFYISIYMKFVLRALIMKELGISNELIADRLNEDSELRITMEALNLEEPYKLFDVRLVSDQSSLSDIDEIKESK